MSLSFCCHILHVANANSGVVVFYLLCLSWITVIFSLPSCHRFPDGTKILKFVSVVQSCIVFAFVLVLLIKAKTFGSNPGCNGHAVVTLFRPFSALNAGRIVGWVVVVAVIAFYSGMTVVEYLPPPPDPIQRWLVRRRVKVTGPSDAQMGHNLESGRHEDRLASNDGNLGSTQKAVDYHIWSGRVLMNFV